MSKAVKDAAGSSDAAVNLPFEEALKRLETIVTTMERDDLPLEGLLSKYEEGTRMIQICQAKLGEAELKIQQLEKSGSGPASLKALAISPEIE